MTTRNLGDSEFASMTVFTWQSTLDTFFCAMYMSKAQLQNMLRGLWPRLGKERVEKVSQQGKYIYVRCLRQKSVFSAKGILVWSHSPRQYSTTNFAVLPQTTNSNLLFREPLLLSRIIRYFEVVYPDPVFSEETSIA